MEQTLIRFYNAFFVKYDKEFMYYQSKSIDDILTHRKTRITLFYRDCMLYADDLDYNKKYYLANEIVPRIIKLTNYYVKKMAPPTPNLIIFENVHVIDRRKKKLEVLYLMEKSEHKATSEEEDDDDSRNILNDLQFSLSEYPRSVDQDDYSDCSYDSSPHDMYDKGEEDLPYPGYNHINFQDFSENYLIMDFKVAADDHSSGRGQSPFYQSTNLPHSFVLTNNCQDKRNERPFPMHSPESSKQSLDLMKDPPGKEPAGEQKKSKVGTFMEYYNSIAVKSPSNILEKYLKRKK